MSIVGTRPPTLDEWNKYELTPSQSETCDQTGHYGYVAG